MTNDLWWYCSLGMKHHRTWSAKKDLLKPPEFSRTRFGNVDDKVMQVTFDRKTIRQKLRNNERMEYVWNRLVYQDVCLVYWSAYLSCNFAHKER